MLELSSSCLQWVSNGYSAENVFEGRSCGVAAWIGSVQREPEAALTCYDRQLPSVKVGSLIMDAC